MSPEDGVSQLEQERTLKHLPECFRVSIVTAVLNGEAHLAEAIQSVRDQTYPHIEHIIVDGGSRDGTVAIIQAHADGIAKWISEPDQGIYDAMNKGISMATGTIVGTLNADDFYPRPDVIDDVVQSFTRTRADAVFADLLVVDRTDPSKVIRYYDSSDFHPGRFCQGWMPPHPTFFTLREHYRRFGLYSTDYHIAADYELLTRFLARHGLAYARIPKVLVHMRSGGISSRNLKSNWLLNREIVRACKENDIHTSMPRLLCKYPRKLLEYVRRPRG
ncbi:glycosyl transferase [Desulfonatronum sp. SC1]|nr:glycosyl transferase [Desulfonatronum sp. SC1]